MCPSVSLSVLWEQGRQLKWLNYSLICTSFIPFSPYPVSAGHPRQQQEHNYGWITLLHCSNSLWPPSTEWGRRTRRGRKSRNEKKFGFFSLFPSALFPSLNVHKSIASHKMSSDSFLSKQKCKQSSWKKMRALTETLWDRFSWWVSTVFISWKTPTISSSRENAPKWAFLGWLELPDAFFCCCFPAQLSVN